MLRKIKLWTLTSESMDWKLSLTTRAHYHQLEAALKFQVIVWNANGFFMNSGVNVFEIHFGEALRNSSTINSFFSGFFSSKKVSINVEKSISSETSKNKVSLCFLLMSKNAILTIVKAVHWVWSVSLLLSKSLQKPKDIFCLYTNICHFKA